MEYIFLILLSAVIVFLGWPRRQEPVQHFPTELQDQKFKKIVEKLDELEKRIALLEVEQPSESPKPLSTQALASYQAIQQDWQAGSSFDEICQRYQLLQGEVELILDLMGEEMFADESRNLHGVHRLSHGQSCSGDQGR